MPGREERAEALPRRAGELHADGVGRQALRAVPARHLGGQRGADGPVAVADRQEEPHGLPALERPARVLDELAVQARAGVGRGARRAAPGGALGRRDGGEQAREVQAAGLPVIEGGRRRQHVRAADHLVDRAEAQRGHQLARLGGHEAHERHHVLGLARETRAQARVLRGDAHGTGVEVALPHHDAPERHERRGAEPELLGAEQGGDRPRRARCAAARPPGRGCGRAGGSARGSAASRRGRSPTGCPRA